MNNKIYTVVMNFMEPMIEDNHHRYKSWEHCFQYFSQDIEQINEDVACLHLSFYLASWGMYRGSSFLLQKDYLVHKDVVQEILKYKYLQDIDLNNILNTDKEFKDIFLLSAFIKKSFLYNHYVTDTLLTKILLGTLGCVPAYDRYFLKILKDKKISPWTKFSEKNFFELIKLYRSEKDTFLKIQLDIQEKTNIKYPVMKLIDMYFFTLGFNKN